LPNTLSTKYHNLRYTTGVCVWYGIVEFNIPLNTVYR